MAKKTIDDHVRNLKDACEEIQPGSVGKLDALNIDWAKFLQNLPALIAMLMTIFGTPTPPVTP